MLGIFLNGIPEKTVVWTANRDEPPSPRTATLQFTTEGRLRLQTQGQRLSAGKELISSRSETNPAIEIFRLKMQNDGNFVQYPVKTPDTAMYTYYASGTNSGYLLNTNSSNIKNITDGGLSNENLYLIRIDPDGIFRLYSHESAQNGSWSSIWSSTNDKCTPKGQCGVNGFCVLIDDRADCNCLPGFDFVVSSNWSSGCVRKFPKDSLKSNDGRSKLYTMSSLENTRWEDSSYSTLSLPTRDDCKHACLDDCNYEAAVFEDGNCKKQRLPLRFGRRSLSDSNILFVKEGVDPKKKKAVFFYFIILLFYYYFLF